MNLLMLRPQRIVAVCICIQIGCITIPLTSKRGCPLLGDQHICVHFVHVVCVCVCVRVHVYIQLHVCTNTHTYI